MRVARLPCPWNSTLRQSCTPVGAGPLATPSPCCSHSDGTHLSSMVKHNHVASAGPKPHHVS